MADKKRKSRDDNVRSGGTLEKKRPFNGKRKKNKRDEGKKKGPRLPSAMRRELGLENHNPRNSDDEEIDSDEEGELHIKDVYEYDEWTAEEDLKKNRRFDPVDNLEYELPEEFEDENLPSDDEDEDDEYSGKRNNAKDNSDQSGDEIEEEDEGRHTRMLQSITGVPAEAFEGTKAKKDVVVSEAYPESEYNPSADALAGDGRINIQDLLNPLHGKRGYTELRKRVQELEKKSVSVQVPLSKVDQEKLERKIAYDQSKNEITKFEPLVKKNREASTIYFDVNTNIHFSTVGAIASEFEPRTDFEKKIASLVTDSKLVDAHKNDGARILELNKISVEDVKDRQDRQAKMRSLLFRHEIKAKHIKKIKSKEFRRGLKKDRLKASSGQTDNEAAKELAMKQEFKRAEERMTLKHKNSSKWAKRILQRGLEAQDEGTRSAISDQLHQHALLTRKMESMKDNSSSDDSSDEGEDDDDDDGYELPDATGQDGASKLIEKAKEKTRKLLEEEDDMPTSGVLSLPFMVRGQKKRKEAVDEEAKRYLQELDQQLEDSNGAGNPKASSSGRRKFGEAKKQSDDLSNKLKSNSNDRDWDSDCEEGMKTNEDEVPEKVVHINPDILREEFATCQESMFQSVDDVIGNPGPKTTYEVAMFASNSWKKVKSQSKLEKNDKSTSRVGEQAVFNKDVKELNEDSDVESEEEMVDGILSSGAQQDYNLPSQSELIHRAFAGDDVEEEFEKEKLETLNEENPEPEKPVLVPGWGQWTHIQKKKGLPSWMVEEHRNATKKREDALKQRKDSHLKHVIISERVDKKAEKLQPKTLPFPYRSTEVYEQSIRMPIAPESNPATAARALIQPQVVKTPGIIIKPIEYRDVNPCEKTDGDKRKGQSQKRKQNKSSKSKPGKKMKAQGKPKAK